MLHDKCQEVILMMMVISALGCCKIYWSEYPMENLAMQAARALKIVALYEYACRSLLS